MAGKIYGIDLGTTNSAIAVYEDGDVRILKNADGYETTPSVVYFTGDEGPDGEDETLVGIQAKNSAALDPLSVAQFVKRYMGEDYKIEAPSGKLYSPEMISALVLKKLVQGAEQFEGEGQVRDVVITVPAYFDDARRTATKQAGKIAGLNVLRVLNEPTAAAIAFGLGSEGGGMTLVYDLGGGTFDVTIMDIGENSFDVIATGGDSELGGLDFDTTIMAMIREKLADGGFEVDDEDDALLADIQDKAEKTKLQLSAVQKAKIPFTIDRKSVRVEITREEFEERTKHLMQRTRFLLEEVMEGKGVAWDDIDNVIAVGGSTHMPMVKKQLEALSGRPITYKVDPDTAVAQGAAVFASNLDLESAEDARGIPGIGPDLSISDVTSQSLGVITVVSRYDSTRQNTVIIPNNTKIPAKRSQIVHTLYDNQTSIKIEVTEGNDPDVEYVKIIGSSTLSIPAYPADSPVEIVYAYDPDQTIFVEVIDKVTDRSLGSFEIERQSNMSHDEVAIAAEIIGKTSVD